MLERLIYFAYCTYLNAALMKRDYPEAEYFQRAVLHDYRLTFVTFARDARDGTCHLESLPGGHTHGVLWKISAVSFHPEITGYEKKRLEVAGEDGQKHGVWTLVVRDPLRTLRPAEDYFASVLSGAKSSGFPEAYLRQLQDLHARL